MIYRVGIDEMLIFNEKNLLKILERFKVKLLPALWFF